MHPKPFSFDDLLEITIRTKLGEFGHKVVVTSEPTRFDTPGKEGWQFTYQPAPGQPFLFSFGSGIIYDRPRPFGLVAFKVFGHLDRKPEPTVSQRYRLH